MFDLLTLYLLFSKEERSERTAHAGNTMDIARIASQGYNGRRGKISRPDGRADRSYAEKRSKYSDAFMSGKFDRERKREKRDREMEEYSYARSRAKTSQRSEMMRSYQSHGSGSVSMDSPITKFKELKMLGYTFDDEDGKKRKNLEMPKFISTPSKYTCHQDSATESSEDKSEELISKSK